MGFQVVRQGPPNLESVEAPEMPMLVIHSLVRTTEEQRVREMFELVDHALGAWASFCVPVQITAGWFERFQIFMYRAKHLVHVLCSERANEVAPLTEESGN